MPLISGLVFLILVLHIQIDIPDSIVFIKYCIYGLERELSEPLPLNSYEL